MGFLKKFSAQLGKAMTQNEMKQIKGGGGYGNPSGCGVCNGQWVRPACETNLFGYCYCPVNDGHWGCFG